MAAIYLIRHGQASWGKADYDDLSEIGIRQSTILGESLRDRVGSPDHVIVGAMRRHRQTAQHTLSAMEIDHSWQEEHRWNEYDHVQLLQSFSSSLNHILQGDDQHVVREPLVARNEQRQRFQDLFDRALLRWIGGQHDDEYSESWPNFKSRIAEALESIIGRQGTTFVFTSGGTISVVVQQLWNIPDQSWPQVNRVITNAAVTKLVIGKRGMHLSTFNDHSPFEGPRRHLLTYR